MTTLGSILLHSGSTRMRIAVVLGILLIQTVFSSCVIGISPARQEYILAKPHGWIELEVADHQIPADPPGKDEKDYVPRPPECRVRLKIDREIFLYDWIFPIGAAPPYTVETGFRLAVPAGPGKLNVEYRYCDILEGKLTTLYFQADIDIVEGFVVPVYLDGSVMTIGAMTENETVTLEEINDRLKNIEDGLRK